MSASEQVRRPHIRVGVVLALAVVGLLGLGAWLALRLNTQVNREAQVAERGAAVMPFDLERTTHSFTAAADGGRQQVVADDPTDGEQVALIRTHLQVEATKFQRGDFSDPAAIHGDGMPGIAELRQGYAQIDVAYSALADGAEIRYTTSDPAMVAALQAWFQAQRGDHGGHAMDHSAP